MLIAVVPSRLPQEKSLLTSLTQQKPGLLPYWELDGTHSSDWGLTSPDYFALPTPRSWLVD